MPEDDARNSEQPLWKRLGWFALLWIGGFLALTIVAMIIRAFIG